MTAGTVKLSRICPFCGRILLDQRLRINDLAVAAGCENAAKLLNLTVPPKGDFERGSRRCVPDRDPHNDIGGRFTKNAFSRCAADFPYAAGFLAVSAPPQRRPCRSEENGGGRERPPCFWPWFGRGAVAVFTTLPRPLGGRSRPKVSLRTALSNAVTRILETVYAFPEDACPPIISTGMKRIFLDPIGRQRTCVGSGTPRARGGPTDEVLGFRPDFIEHQLAHAVRDPNGRADDRTAFMKTTDICCN